MNHEFEYDKTNPYSIEEYGQRLIGKTFRDILKMDDGKDSSDDSYGRLHSVKNYKGGLGILIEERFYHYKANNESAPDFSEAGVELKTTPYKTNKDKTISAKERVSLNEIDYIKVANEPNFEKSHFWYKNRMLLLVYYLYLKETTNRLDYRIDYVRLFTPSEEDLKIIKEDYNTIVEKIRAGLAHELSEADTYYLSACTKGQDSSKTRKQPYNTIPAKYRAFAYKASYMTYVLNQYILGKKPQYERLAIDKTENFETSIIQRILEYRGRTCKELRNQFGLDGEKVSKAIKSQIVFRILGVKGNKAEEFVKANIQVKTIRILINGQNKESVSFPAFRFNELIGQEWEQSSLYETLEGTKFLFVVFRENEDGDYVLSNARFWNMPYSDLQEVRTVWEKTKDTCKMPPQALHNGKHYIGIFPKESEHRICHVRPHGRDSRDTYPLPDGRLYPKQCFWLNRAYILSAINNSN